MSRKHNHYFKNVENLKEIDVYRVLELFSVTNQAIGHALKKLLVAGGRGAGKDIGRDVQEAIDTLQRWQEMKQEDAVVAERPAVANVPGYVRFAEDPALPVELMPNMDDFRKLYDALGCQPGEIISNRDLVRRATNILNDQKQSARHIR